MADGAEIAKAYVQIIPTTDKIGINIENAMNSVDTSKAGEASGNSFASGFGSVLAGLAQITVAAVTAAAAGITALTKEAIASYAEYEQLVGGMETLYKENADKMVKYASDAYKTAGLSANEYMETATSFSASLLASTGGDTEKAADAANQAIIDMSDNANKMGTSMESIQNAYRGFAKQNYTMLDNLSLGYGGTKSEMERLLADAEKLSGVKYDMENLNDVYSAIHVIQTELGITGTTAAEASATISGSLGMAGAAWKNLVTGLADDNANFDELIDSLVSSISTVAGNIVPRITKAFEGIGNLVTQLAPIFAQMLPEMVNSFLPPLLEAATTLVMALVENLDSILTPIVEELPVIVDMLLEILPDFVEALLEMLPIIVDAGMQILISLIEGIAEALPTIIPQIVDVVLKIVDILIQNAPLLLDAALLLMKNLGDGIIQAIPTIVGALPDIINNILQFLNEAIPDIINAGMELFMALIDNLPQSITTIVGALPQIIEGITTFLTENLPIIIEAGVQLFMALVENLPEIIDGLVAVLPDLVQALVKALLELDYLIIKCGFDLLVSLVKDLPLILAEIVVSLDKLIDGMIEALAAAIVQFIETGKDIVNGIAQGISDAKDAVINKIKEMCKEAWDSVKEFFGIASPSKLMRWGGHMLDDGLALGIADGSENVIQSALSMSKDVTDVFDGMNADINNALNDNLRVSSSLSIENNKEEDPLINNLATLQAVISELNARLEAGFGLEWDDRQLGRLVQTYA